MATSINNKQATALPHIKKPDVSRAGLSKVGALVDSGATDEVRAESRIEGTVPLQKAQASAQLQKVSATRILKPPPFDPKQPADAQLIVAGAGIGGGPISRLAEQGFQVKFLEGGPAQRDWFDDVPLLHAKASDTSFNVDGYSPPMALLAYFVDHYEAQQKNLDLKFHDELGGILYPRGQGPGGSGNVNANVAVAPDKKSCEGLFVQSGKDPRFSPASLQKYFARAQDTGPLFSFLETVGHVAKALQDKGLKREDFARLTEPGGWQQITHAVDHLRLKDLTGDPQLRDITLHILAYTAKKHSFADTLIRVMTLFDSNNELNFGREGFTNMPISVGKDGRRSSVVDRLKAVLQTRPDTMSLECETKVHSLIFNKEGTRVEGMRVLKPAKAVLEQRQLIYALQENLPNIPADKVEDYNARIGREIDKLKELEANTPPEMEIKRSTNGYVLSAGTFEDPNILIRSGYGPKDVLERLGIPPVGGAYHEAVGRNLKDRREITVMYHAKDKFALIDGLGLGKNPHNDDAMKVWEKSGRGPYATNGVVCSYQFKSDPSQPEADIFAFFVPGPFRGYDTGYAVDATKYPQTFTAVLLDKNGNLVSDDTKRLMTSGEFEELRDRLGTVQPDPEDPMKSSINFNYQRPKPGENPPLYSAMLRMKDLFKGQDVLTELVPGDPFDTAPTSSKADLIRFVESTDLFPKYPADDLRSAEDWFRQMDVPLFDKDGKEHKLTLVRTPLPGQEGAEKPELSTRAKLLVDGKPASDKALAGLSLVTGKPLSAAGMKEALQRGFLIEFQASQSWGHHANGTCSMGPDAQNNVIGSDFRVHGVENLWVASASSTPAAVNPGTFIQLYVAAAVGEAAGDAIGEQMRANENHLGRMSPLATRLPAEQSKKNTLGENLLIAIDRARGHVGDSQGVLTGEAVTQLLAMQKQRGFSKDDVALAEKVYDRAEKREDKNAPVLKVLAGEVRKMRKDQGFLLDIKAALRRNGDHLTSDQVLRVLREVGLREDEIAKTTGAPPDAGGSADWGAGGGVGS